MTTDMILFNPAELATQGEKFLGALLEHELRKEAAETELAQASARDVTINTELMRAALFLHSEDKIDLEKIYGTREQVASLNRAILVELGIAKRIVTDTDKVEYVFQNPALAEAYEFKQAVCDYKHDKEKEPKPLYTEAQVAAERVKRSRRNSLNIRLATACKSALAMYKAGAGIEHVVYREKADGSTVPVLTKGPIGVMGEQAEVELVSGNAAKAKGATYTPTISGLAKVEDMTHKPASKQETEHGKKDAGPISEADFLALMNAAMLAINKREGQFTDAEKTAMKNVGTALMKAVK